MLASLLLVLVASTRGASLQLAQNVNDREETVLLSKGQSAIVQKRFEDAIASCRAGLEKLGHAYARANVVDDTGLKLAAADNLRREGKVDNASSMYCRVLAERLELLIDKE